MAAAAAAASAAGVTDDESDHPNYDNLLVEDLKFLLRERGLRVGGRKAELIERLKQYNEAVGDVPW